MCNPKKSRLSFSQNISTFRTSNTVYVSVYVSVCVSVCVCECVYVGSCVLCMSSCACGLTCTCHENFF